MTLNDVFIKKVKTILGGRTPYWLSQESGISQATLSRVLNGQMNPTIKMVEKIANGLGVHASVLLTIEEDESVPSDILLMLSKQPPFVYDAVRGMLKPLQKKK